LKKPPFYYRSAKQGFAGTPNPYKTFEKIKKA
jgi:hypothetical protein